MSSKRTIKATTKTDDTELWDANSTAQFFKDLGLRDFYQQRSKLDPNAYLKPYLALDSLKDYRLLAKDRSVLRPKRTYIRYIHTSEANKDRHYRKHLKTGGVLISAGYYRGKKYVASDNHTEWSVLRLKFKPKVLTDAKGHVIDDNPTARVFNIRLNRCHVFYKYFRGNTIEDAMNLLDEGGVELVH